MCELKNGQVAMNILPGGPVAPSIIFSRLLYHGASVIKFAEYAAGARPSCENFLSSLDGLHGPATYRTLRRHFTNSMNNNGPVRAHPLYFPPLPPEVKLFPMALDTEAMVKADPNYGLRDFTSESLVNTPIRVRALLMAHIGLCNRCNLSPKDRIIVEERKTDLLFFPSIFSLLHRDCYAEHLYGGLAYGYAPRIIKRIRAFDIPTYKSVLNPESRDSVQAAWLKQTNMPGLFSPGSTQYVSSLTVTKKNKDVWLSQQTGAPVKVRICVDLSRQINDRCADFRFRYCDLRYILSQLRKGVFVAMLDLRSYFLTLGLAQEFQKYCSFRDLHGNIRRYRRLPFGMSSAPAWANCVSSEICRILMARGIPELYFLTDDFCIVSDSYEDCLRYLNIALATLKEFNIEVATEKTIYPTQTPLLLGAILDTVRLTISCPLPTLEWCLNLISTAKARGLRKRMVNSLTGTLQWVSCMTSGGLPYLRGLYDSVKGWRHRHGLVKFDDAAKSDLDWWVVRIKALIDNGCSARWLCAHEMDRFYMASDASGTSELGCGAWLNDTLYRHRWRELERSWSVPEKELYPIVAMLEGCACATLRGRLIFVLTDSITNFYALNAGSSRSVECNSLIKRLSAVETAGECVIVALWLPREFNVLTDLLSKFALSGLPLPTKHS